MMLVKVAMMTEKTIDLEVEKNLMIEIFIEEGEIGNIKSSNVIKIFTDIQVIEMKEDDIQEVEVKIVIQEEEMIEIIEIEAIIEKIDIVEEIDMIETVEIEEEIDMKSQVEKNLDNLVSVLYVVRLIIGKENALLVWEKVSIDIIIIKIHRY